MSTKMTKLIAFNVAGIMKKFASFKVICLFAAYFLIIYVIQSHYHEK